MLLFLWACVGGAPEVVTVRVWVGWPGASPGDVETALTLPVETSLAQLPGAEQLIGESWSGLSRVTVTMPAASAHGLSDALDRLSLPVDAARPWAEAVPAEVSSWVVPRGTPTADLHSAFGVGGAWSDTETAPVTEVIFPAGNEGALEALRQRTGWTTTDELLGPSLRTEAAVRPAPSRILARWNGAPVDLWHVGKPEAEVGRWWAERGAAVVRAPSGSYVELWGEDPTAVETNLRAAGATGILTVRGRPFPGGGPEPGRLEVTWDGPTLLPGAGPAAVVTLVRGTPEQLAALGPPPRTTWDIEVDAERAAAFGVGPDRVAATIRDATVGTRFVAPDGAVVEVRIGEAASLEAIAALVVGERDGVPIRVGDVAVVGTVQTERYRLRYDRSPAAIVGGAVPEGLEVVARVPRSRLGG